MPARPDLTPLRPGLFDDLGVFLAVHEAGSVTAAASKLGLDPGTVSRRVARLEEALGVTLLVRGGRSLSSSDAGESLARRVRAAVNEVEVGIDEVTGAPDRLAGPVRLTAPTEFGCSYLIPALGDFVDQHPDVELFIDLGTALVDLDRREADVAFRTVRPTTGDVVARKIPGRAVLAFHAAAVDPERAWLRWVTFSREEPWFASVVASHPGARVVLRSTDLAGVRAACAAGLGSALLPEFIGQQYGLVPLAGFAPVNGPPIWMAAPRTSLELPRVRALWDYVVAKVDAGT